MVVEAEVDLDLVTRKTLQVLVVQVAVVVAVLEFLHRVRQVQQILVVEVAVRQTLIQVLAQAL